MMLMTLMMTIDVCTFIFIFTWFVCYCFCSRCLLHHCLWKYVCLFDQNSCHSTNTNTTFIVEHQAYWTRFNDEVLCLIFDFPIFFLLSFDCTRKISHVMILYIAQLIQRIRQFITHFVGERKKIVST